MKKAIFKLLLGLLFVSNLPAQNMAFYHAMMSTAQGYDINAQAYIKAELITSEAQKRPIDYLCRALKIAGLWNTSTGLNDIYPYLGTYQKHNLIDTSTFKMTYHGTYTLSAAGCQFNGTTGYAQTSYTPSVSMTNGTHVSMYSGANIENTGDKYDLGTQDAGNKELAMNVCYNAGANAYHLIGFNTDGTVFQQGNLNGNSKGFYVSTKVSGTNKFYRNGVLVSSASDAIGLPTKEMYIGCLNLAFNTAYGFSNKLFSFVSFGNGLSAADQATLENIVYTYNRMLGRAYTNYNYFFGDSYTFGAYTGRTDNNTWVWKLDSMLGNQPCLNNGVTSLAITQNRVTGASIDKTTLPVYGIRDNYLVFTFSTDNDAGQNLTVPSNPTPNTIANMDSDFVTLFKYAHNTKGWPYNKIRVCGSYYRLAADTGTAYPWERGIKQVCANYGLNYISHLAYETSHGGDANVQANIKHPSASSSIVLATNIYNNW